MDALTIYVEQNPDELAYRIYGDADHEVAYAPITEGYEEMTETVEIDNSTYFTFTVQNPGTIRHLYILNDRGELFDRDDLEITGNAYLKWDNQQKRLMLEGAPIDYGFRVNGIWVTETNAADILSDNEENAGKVSYDAESNTLTLNGVNVNAWNTFIHNQFNEGLNVELKGENNISPYYYSVSFLETRKMLNITGGGVLNFTTAQYGYGICAWDNQDDQQSLSVNISDVTLNINGGEWGIYAYGGSTINISNASISISGVSRGAFHADELNLDGVRYVTPQEATFVYGEIREADGETIAKTVVIAPIPPTVILDELATEELAGVEGLVDVELQYTFHAGWNAICLPFDISEETLIEKFGEGVKVAVMESQELTDNVATINFAQADGLMANVPSLLYISAVPTDVLSFTNVSLTLGASTTVSGTAFDFVGTTTQGTVNAGDYILVNGTMTKAAGGNTINAYRAYLKCNDLTGARIVKLSIEGEDGTTTISEIAQGAVQGEPIYNLSGVRQNGTVRNGLYIQGGKLIIKNSSKK